MPTIAEALRECHRLRKHLRTLQEEIDRGPRVLKAHQARLAEEEQAHKTHFDTITKLKLKQRDDEGTLKQTDTRLTKLEGQLNQGAGNQKEYDAKQSEIRQAREKKTALEEDILTTMGRIEEMTGQIPAVEKKWADARAEFAQFQVEAKERLDRLKNDQEISQAELAKVEATLPAKVRPTYDAQVRGHGPNALAGVKGGTCQGCRTTVNQQKLIELGGGAFACCSTCGKLLYLLDE